MKRVFTSLAIALLFPAVAQATTYHSEKRGNTAISSFDQSKKLLMDEIYNNNSIRKTVYCNAQFNKQKKVTLTDGYINSIYKNRAKRVEFEHIVPAENFGRSFKEWRDGSPICEHNGKKYKGRRCASKANQTFKYMLSDLYNLWPAQGSINGAHNNYRWAELPNIKTRFGSCDFKYDAKSRKAEPTDRSKGIVARTELYMALVYPKHYQLNKQQRSIFTSWDNNYPVTQFECERAKIIEKIQGNKNPILDNRCKIQRIPSPLSNSTAKLDHR